MNARSAGRKTTALLEPLADAIGRHVLAAGAIFADDTPVSMLAPGAGRTQTARLWTYARDERFAMRPPSVRGPWRTGRERAAGGMVSLLRRQERAASEGPPRPLPGMDAC
jgi:Transposase IS66 family